MTAGSASPNDDPGTPTSGVPPTRPTFSAPLNAGSTRGTTFSKVLVIGLVALFVVASAAFLASASGARHDATPAPGASSGPDASVATGLRGGLAAAVAGAGPSVEPDDPSVGPEEIALANPQPPVGDPAAGELLASPAPSLPIDQIASLPSDTTPGDPAAAGDPAATGDPAAIGDPPGTTPTLQDPAATVELSMPIVPVIGFWATETAITRDDLVAALRGQGGGYDRVLVPSADRDAIAEALGITIAPSVESAEPAAIERAIKRGGVLGLVRASDVTYRMRTLGIGGDTLFGNDRLRNVDNWPLIATVSGPAGSAWDQKATWTLVAGGDSFTDRGIYERVVNRKKGIDFPFDGGTARVTGHYCCGPFVTPGHPVPSYELSGPKGIVRAMTKDADLAIANHESPIPNNWAFHLHGFLFSGDPALTEIFTRAGIDWMSLANNHIKDYGTSGIVDTRKNLDKWGIKYAGAGKDLRQAREYSVLEVKGVRVAIIPCVGVGAAAYASKNSGGGTPCKNRFLLPDIREASGRADFVIVFPHWGVEYDRDPTGSQRQLAADWVEAGADLVLGAHSHVAGAIEEIDGSPVFYSMGNFIFDQNWATYTMESFLLEATFQGDRIVQVRLHPFLSHDQAQPNFLDPAKDDGKALMKAVRQASFIDW
jgi:hypothetical protein